MNWRMLTVAAALLGGLALAGCPDDESCPSDTEICDDYIDNDCDGLIDKEDPTCPKCTYEICNDKEDNDCDGKVDEADVDDCKICLATEVDCENMVDDDCDGKVDMDDTDDCMAAPSCVTCGEFLTGATQMPPVVGTICPDGTPAGGMSTTLLTNLQMCTCATGCAMECMGTTACGGMNPSAGPCLTCVQQGACASDFGACLGDVP